MRATKFRFFTFKSRVTESVQKTQFKEVHFHYLQYKGQKIYHITFDCTTTKESQLPISAFSKNPCALYLRFQYYWCWLLKNSIAFDTRERGKKRCQKSLKNSIKLFFFFSAKSTTVRQNWALRRIEFFHYSILQRRSIVLQQGKHNTVWKYWNSTLTNF